jgi:hypothetical protein
LILVTSLLEINKSYIRVRQLPERTRNMTTNLEKKQENGKTARFCCSNPNCRKVFSRPKIIKYYVCPTCQTLIDLKASIVPVQSRRVEKRVLSQGPLKVSMPEEVNSENEQETSLIDQSLTQPEENNSPKESEKRVSDEALEMELPNDKAPAISGVSFSEKLEEMIAPQTKETDKLSLDPKCLYFFGYLNQRNKGEGIPETCFDCPKSVECMLIESNRSRASVNEIKKWYSFNQ